MPESLGAFDPTTIYDEAVKEYEDASSEFWRYLSDHAVQLLGLQPGERVLDVPCGTGHSVFPAAERVGPSGQVVAFDISERMVGFVHEKAARLQLGNIEVAVADMARLDPPDEPFDAVLCSLGIFFVPDMPAALRGLAAQVRPGGRLALAVFGESFYEPLRTTFVEAVHESAPAVEVVEPWSRVRTEADLRDLFEARVSRRGDRRARRRTAVGLSRCLVADRHGFGAAQHRQPAHPGCGRAGAGPLRRRGRSSADHGAHDDQPLRARHPKLTTARTARPNPTL